ncbi:MAG: ATP-dependent DNA helicase [Nitrospirota bacterium]|nr:ATP-dependent DNA helicase [Nitrospirota bacterium]
MLGPGGVLEQQLPGFVTRPQQLDMAHAVADALADGHHLLVEAGTGTGKTFAYLIPALLSGKRVVISTGTRVLQDQILDKDLAALSSLMDLKERVAVLKGRSNYLCLHRFDSLSAAGRDAPLSRRELISLSAWASRTETGDKAELTDFAEDHPVWQHVTVSAEQCLGGKCPEFDSCYITRARRRAMKADLIVVNHHLLFADLGIKSGAFGEVIPHYDAVIFDEAHLVEDVATTFFGTRVSAHRLRELAGDTQRETIALPPEDARRLMGDSQRLLDRSQPFFAQLAALEDHSGDARRTLYPDRLPPQLAADAEALIDAARLLAVALAGHDGRSEDLFALARRAEALHGDLVRVMGDPRPETVYWYERKGHNGVVGASPLHVGPLLNEHLYARVNSAVFTSATLATGSGMDYVRDRLGFGKAAEPYAPLSPSNDAGTDAGPPARATARDLSVGSPFNYPEQAVLYLPNHLPSPKAPAYADAVAAEIAMLMAITGGRALLLFTSYRMLDEVYRRCADDLPGTVLKQGDIARARLLETFVRESPSVLFATGAFWQGVDVPGEALSCVVIDRLPFAAPDDPVVAARVRALEQARRNAFVEYQVPMAALTLKQGVGRLIRTVEDRGVVAVLDHRIRRMPYGKVFLNSLPPMRRVETIQEVAGFFHPDHPVS